MYETISEYFVRLYKNTFPDQLYRTFFLQQENKHDLFFWREDEAFLRLSEIGEVFMSFSLLQFVQTIENHWDRRNSQKNDSAEDSYLSIEYEAWARRHLAARKQLHAASMNHQLLFSYSSLCPYKKTTRFGRWIIFISGEAIANKSTIQLT